MTHLTEQIVQITYVRVVLPIATPKPYTYHVPEALVGQVAFGKRVEVQFGRSKLYAALVIEVHQNPPKGYKTKPVLSVIDEVPIALPEQVELWQWMAGYYSCTLGEVMQAAVPANLKLVSETLLTLSKEYVQDVDALEDEEYLIAEALSIREELTIGDVRDILGRKTVFPLIRQLLEKRILVLKEDLKQKYKPRTLTYVRLTNTFQSPGVELQSAFDLLKRAPKQEALLLAYLHYSKKDALVKRADLCRMADADTQLVNKLVDKGIFELFEKETSRLGTYSADLVDAHEMTEQQQVALEEIRAHFKAKPVVLLQGVTGSGKTQVYVELIRSVLEKGKQVLYLLPEIALTSQIIARLQQVFGNEAMVYHSRLNNNERVEVWKTVADGHPLILGARSALFLPFRKLGLVVVDEEHDPSYKQQDPAPRYNGRDAAVYLGKLHQAPVLLGTATPSIESFYNARSGKYGLVKMPERFGGIQLPDILIVDMKEAQKQRQLQSHFTSFLLEQLQQTLNRGEQAILFQNRRGYAPTYQCSTCDWHSECIHCDVSLTYHKFRNNLKCHYCGYETHLPPACPACGSKQLQLKGFGTEKIEDELKIYLPEARVGRMDFETVRSKNAHARIIQEFEEGQIQILVGTQMVTKGLDFDNVGLVGVLNADQLLQFPDFRAGERAFQLMTQVSGRAGRRKTGGQVIIQAYNVGHPVLREVIENDFPAFFKREMRERHEFEYPPFTRLIRVSLRHKKPPVLQTAAQLFDKTLRPRLGARLKGPATPYIGRVRGYYLADFLIKLERDARLITATKQWLEDTGQKVVASEGLSGVRISVDVDPA